MSRDIKGRRGLAWAAFALYTAWILWMMLFGRLGAAQAVSLSEYAREHFVLFPLKTILQQVRLSLEGSRHAIRNLGGNVALFFPYGWFLPGLFRSLRRYGRCLLAFAAAVAAVELAQLLFRVGVCEVDDLLLNCLGASLGYWSWRLAYGKLGAALTKRRG